MNKFTTFSDVVLDQIFLILYRELYYRHVYSRLQPNIDDRFHSYENSCELFNYLLSMSLSLVLQLGL
jgi:translation initiation factor 3 subunit L